MTEPRFKSFIEGALIQVKAVKNLTRESLTKSALDRLEGYLTGGLEVFKITHQKGEGE